MTGLIVRSALVSAFIGVALAMGGCGSWQSPEFFETRTLEAAHSALQPVQVETGNGAVTVRRTDVDRAIITAEIAALTQDRLDRTRVMTARSDSDGLHVWVDWPDGRRKGSERARFDIETPGASAIRVRTSNGRVTISGLSGPADLDTSNGRITVTDHDGPVRAATSNGRLQLERVTGDILGRTSNGRVQVVDAHGAVDVDTSNGRVDVRFAADATGPLEIETSNGSVSATLPSGYTGELRLSTGNGRISFDLPENVRGVSQSKRRATIVLGDGDSVSRIRTSNGSVSIKTLN